MIHCSGIAIEGAAKTVITTPTVCIPASAGKVGNCRCPLVVLVEYPRVLNELKYLRYCLNAVSSLNDHRPRSIVTAGVCHLSEVIDCSTTRKNAICYNLTVS